jgi:CDP-diacylglycerol--serine O-phosphatidyltransferase
MAVARPWRYVVPNVFTGVSAVLGLASIVLALEANLYWSAWCILWCALLDKADGTAARLLKASSEFGTEFDSMADLIAFGLAPAFLIYSAGRHAWDIDMGTFFWWVLTIGCLVHALGAAIRLARFNIAGFVHGQRYFTGIPSPLSGALVASAFLVGLKYGLPPELLRPLPVVLGLLGIGMVSRLPVPKLMPRKNTIFNVFQMANIIAIYLCGIFVKFPEYVLSLAILYLVGGSIYGLTRAPSSNHPVAQDS